MGKMRSPNFPTIALSQAIDLTEKIFREDRTNAIEKEDAAKHMGYSGLTGRTLKLLGALSQFGLLDKVAKGQVRVSSTAVSILHPSNDGERLEALARAGAAPTLFKKVHDAFPEEPSERTITSFLIREGFTDVAIPAVLKSYRETNRFLAASGVSGSYGQDAEDDADLVLDEDEDTPMKEATAREFQKAPTPPSDEGELRVNFDMRSVSLSGRTTSPEELGNFIKALTALHGLFESVASKEEDDAEAESRSA
jgi:hypothetical protein